MVTIKSFEIAKLFGLKYLGEVAGAKSYEFCYEFTFHGKSIYVNYASGPNDAVDEDEAKEEAAKRVLLEIGKRIALYI